MVYGYARVSTPTQKIQRQVNNIKELYPTAVVLQEVFTGKSMDRPEWNKLIKTVKSGDTIVFDSITRMGRNVEEGTKTYFELYDKDVELIFLKEEYLNTSLYKESTEKQITAPASELDAIIKSLNDYFHKLAERQIQIAFQYAEKEAKDISRYTKEGIALAKLDGKQIGQRPGNKLHVKKEAPAKEAIRKYSKSFNGSNSDVECIKLIGISRNTYYKYKRELLM